MWVGKAKPICLTSAAAAMNPRATDQGFDMAFDADIYRAAELVIEQYSADAAWWASQRVSEFLIEGDAPGVALWTDIQEAIEELQRRRSKRRRVTCPAGASG
jgi:hypothetical protein